jgi:hypothetical protein
VIRHLLEEIEKAPNPRFSKKELLSISAKDFGDLCKKKILVYCQPADSGFEQLRFPRCQHGCPLTLVRAGAKLEAVCLDHPEEDPISVSKDDLSRYAFSLDQFLFEVRFANRIDGDISRIQGGHFYIGYKYYNDSRVGFVFVRRIEGEEMLQLSGLRRLCEDDDILVVLTPKSGIEDLTLKGQLRKDNIVQMSLYSSLDPETSKLPIEELISGVLKPKERKKRPIRELTAKQKADYKTLDYKCYDEIHIPGTIPVARSNIVVLNGDEVRLGDSLFLLFLRLLVELKKKKGGWVSIQDLASEGIVSDPQKYQIYSNLRNAIQGSLLGKDGKEFVESDKSGNYRMSLHPDLITLDKKKLRRHPDHRIVSVVGALSGKGCRLC